MAISKVVVKFQTKMAEKGWKMDYDEKERKFLDPIVQEFYEVFLQGYMSAPVWDNGFHVIARITDKGLQFGQTPYIHFTKATVDKQLRFHTQHHGEGFIALSGRKMDLKELEACMGRKISSKKSVIIQQNQPKVEAQKEPDAE